MHVVFWSCSFVKEIVPQTMAIYGKPTPAISRLGIKPYVWITECLRGEVSTNGTAFPQSIGLGATFRLVLFPFYFAEVPFTSIVMSVNICLINLYM